MNADGVAPTLRRRRIASPRPAVRSEIRLARTAVAIAFG
jgi:hypothetical protein